MKVNILNQQDDVEIDLDKIGKISSYISDKFDQDKRCEANIIFVPRALIKQLNYQYRNIDKETDVLSFSYLADESEPGLESEIEFEKETHGSYTIGEIIICPAVAMENAVRQQGEWNLMLELCMLIIHGFLHMYNYDHQQEEERERMFDIQDSMLGDVKKRYGLQQ
jgi:probable rRNA maturation factor